MAGAVVAAFATTIGVYMPAKNPGTAPKIGSWKLTIDNRKSEIENRKLEIGNYQSEIGNWKLLFFAFCALGLEEFGEELAALISQDAGVDFDCVVQAGVVAEIV